MSNTQMLESYSVIPPEILEEMKELCPLEIFTVDCLRKQLLKRKLIKENTFIVLNGKIIRDLETAIQETDKIQILPMIAGG